MNNPFQNKSSRGNSLYRIDEETKEVSSTKLLREYIHEIRNLKILTKEMIQHIRNMPCEDKMEIILAFNDVVEGLQQLID
jgi:hypothetical protein